MCEVENSSLDEQVSPQEPATVTPSSHVFGLAEQLIFEIYKNTQLYNTSIIEREISSNIAPIYYILPSSTLFTQLYMHAYPDLLHTPIYMDMATLHYSCSVEHRAYNIYIRLSIHVRTT